MSSILVSFYFKQALTFYEKLLSYFFETVDKLIFQSKVNINDKFVRFYGVYLILLFIFFIKCFGEFVNYYCINFKKLD